MMRVETAQSLVRPLVMIAFAIALIVGFFMDKVGGEAFLGAYAVVQTWFFKSRDENASAR